MAVAELFVLGTAASVPDAAHDTLGLALGGPGWVVAVDCGGSPLHKLAQAGFGWRDVRAVILTHRHADHLYGLPMLAQGLWLAGRQAPLPIYGPEQALDVARRLLDLFDLVRGSERFLPAWHPVALREGEPVAEVEGVRISATPVAHHGVDTLALRFDNTLTGRAAIYSADTEPSEALVRLARGAELLVHEATGAYPGHSSPAQAGEAARRAGVRRLALIHYPAAGRTASDLEDWVRQASAFPGPATLAQDGDRYPF